MDIKDRFDVLIFGVLRVFHKYVFAAFIPGERKPVFICLGDKEVKFNRNISNR